MKNKCKVLLATSLMAVTGFAFAHTQSGTLGSATKIVSAVDVFAVSCSNDGNGVPAKLSLSVKATKGGPVSIVASKGGKTSTSLLAQGAGEYIMTVSKPKSKGIATYIATFHCQTASGVHSGTGAVQIKNE